MFLDVIKKSFCEASHSHSPTLTHSHSHSNNHSQVFYDIVLWGAKPPYN